MNRKDPTKTTTPPTKPASDEAEMAKKITDAFWQATDLSALDALMELAKTRGYGNHPEVMAAYNELKLKL